MRLTASLSGLIVVAALSNCKHQDGSSYIKHDFAAWDDMEDTPYTWADISAADFMAQSRHPLTPYPNSSPRQQRLNAWMAAIHQEIKTLNPKLAAPEPKIFLVKNDEANAYVSPATACLPIEIIYKGGQASANNSTNDLVFSRLIEPMQIYRGPRLEDTKAPCHTLNIAENDLAIALKMVFGEQYRCLSKPNKTSQMAYRAELDLNCAGPIWTERLSSFARAPRVRFTQIANQIVVHDKLFEMSEGQLVAVLAHEAGHYYRAHGLSHARTYDFFYKLDEKHNISSRPTPLTSDEEISSLGIKVTGKDGRFLALYGLPNQNWHSLIYLGIAVSATSLPNLCSDADCNTQCLDLARHMQFAAISAPNAPLSSFPWTPAPKTNEAKAFYQKFEQLLESCAAKIPITADNELDVGAWFKNWPIPDQIEVREPLAEKNILNALKKLNKQADAMINERNSEVFALYEKANKARLGLYTAEQEADEISLELITRLGLPAKDAITGYIFLSRSTESERPKNVSIPGKLNAAQCEAALNKGFPEFIPIADYSDSHHSSCFRAYNLWRETKAHEGDMSKITPQQSEPKLDSALWRRLQVNRT